MNLESEFRSSTNKVAESSNEPTKHSKILYSREFLLSLSELDVCKKLPSGFDQSILSEFEDACLGIQDRQRIPGSLPLQSYRRSEYGSSPPARGDSSSYSRGIHGRWDSRSSGRSERDSDSQSDRDSDCGRRYGNQSRRSWQSPEHDGLLGSGSFPRPGYAPGMSASKFRATDHYQLSRSNEPYHPPRPYKAVPHLRKDTHDSFNDETFGSTECTSHDKAEEERRRRESFELMRKEQQKALQEKQKLNPDKHKGDIADISELLGDTKDGKRLINRCNESEESVMQVVSNNDTSKSSLPIAGPRPLRSTGTRSLAHSVEDGRAETEEHLSNINDDIQNGILDNHLRQSSQQKGLRELKVEHYTVSSNKDGETVDSSTDLGISNKKLGADDQLCKDSCLLGFSKTQDGREVEFDKKKLTRHNIIDDSGQGNSKSILEKLFSSALSSNLSGSPGFSEHHDTQQEDTWSPNSAQSSKFAHWFLEDEKKVPEGPSSARPSDLLSFVVTGEKGGSQPSIVETTQQIQADPIFQTSEPINRFLMSDMKSSTVGSNQEAVPAILTCEDLEQTILFEYGESSSILQASNPGLSVCGAKTEEAKAAIDDHASQHLLSLLQKGTSCQDRKQSPNPESGCSDKVYVSEGAIASSAAENSEPEKAENNQSGKSLTLETLFGSAFMKELQSVGAPVSVQRTSGGSARMDISDLHGTSFGTKGDGLFPASTVGIGPSSNHESNILHLSQTQESKLDNIGNWSGINDNQIDMDQLKHQSIAGPMLGGFNGTIDVQLPEEESLITVGDPVKNPSSMFMSAESSTKGESLSSNKAIDITDKLAALNTVFKAEGQMVGQEGPSFFRGPDTMEPEIPFSNLHNHPLSAQFHPSQMNHGRPLFHPLESQNNHVSSRMNFMTPEGSSHQFPANILRPPFHHPNTGLAGFDHPHPILQQMQMSGNFPPAHLIRQVPRGGPVLPHAGSHPTTLMQELHPMQGLHLGQQQQQANFGGLGIPSQAPDISGGSSHPMALQRLLEMELRANAKQVHPLAAAGHSQGVHGHDLEMGFRYR
ncbi:hypothetical protein NMG60_11022811 [Bertholletia excelsa]